MGRRNGRPTQRRAGKRKELGKYKSALEKQVADDLKAAGIKFDYEPRTYTLQEAFRYNAPYLKMTPKGKNLLDKSGKRIDSIDYTPDFVDPDEGWFIEAKGYNKSNPTFWIRWKLFMDWLLRTRAGSLPMIFVVKNRGQIQQAIEVIKNKKQ